LRLDVVGIGCARTQAQRSDGEDAGAATVIDQALLVGQQRLARKQRVEKLEAQARGGVSAGAEGETRVERDHDSALGLDCCMRRADPKMATKLQRMKVPQPLALPGFLFDRRDRQASSIDAAEVAKVVAQGIDSCGVVNRAHENRLHTRGGPETHFTWSRFEYRIVALIGQNDRDGARLEADFFHELGVEPVEIERDRKLRHG